MNRQLLEILNQQEQSEQTGYQSEAFLLNMIRQDFTNSESLLHRLDALDGGIVSLFRQSNFPAIVREAAVLPVPAGKGADLRSGSEGAGLRFQQNAY